MKLEIVKVHLFKKELKYMLINSLIKVKFLLKIRRLLQIKICNNFFIISNKNMEFWNVKLGLYLIFVDFLNNYLYNIKHYKIFLK